MGCLARLDGLVYSRGRDCLSLSVVAPFLGSCPCWVSPCPSPLPCGAWETLLPPPTPPGVSIISCHPCLETTRRQREVLFYSSLALVPHAKCADGQSLPAFPVLPQYLHTKITPPGAPACSAAVHARAISTDPDPVSIGSEILLPFDLALPLSGMLGDGTDWNPFPFSPAQSPHSRSFPSLCSLSSVCLSITCSLGALGVLGHVSIFNRWRLSWDYPEWTFSSIVSRFLTGKTNY